MNKLFLFHCSISHQCYTLRVISHQFCRGSRGGGRKTWSGTSRGRRGGGTQRQQRRWEAALVLGATQVGGGAGPDDGCAGHLRGRQWSSGGLELAQVPHRSGWPLRARARGRGREQHNEEEPLVNRGAVARHPCRRRPSDVEQVSRGGANWQPRCRWAAAQVGLRRRLSPTAAGAHGARWRRWLGRAWQLRREVEEANWVD